MLPGVFKPQWVFKESPSFGFVSLFFIFSEIKGPRGTKSGKISECQKLGQTLKMLEDFRFFRKITTIYFHDLEGF